MIVKICVLYSCNMQLSVIIVNYNVKYFLEHCLLSVIKACGNIEAEILVADNNSSDGSKAYLQPKFPNVHFFWNPDNTGFASANNQMLTEATGQYVLFLNPDTIVPEDCFTKCIDFFKSRPDCGALGARMTDGSGRFLRESKRLLPGLLSGLYKSLGFAGMYYADHLPEKQDNKTAVLAGAFMMLSREAIEITKGFDEAFFMYGEDVDLSYRISKAGLNNYYFAGTTVIHFKGESTQKQTSIYVDRFYGAMELFAKKHYQREKLHYPLMKMGIALSKKIAKLKNKKAFKNGTPVPKNVLTIIAGNEQDILQAENLVSKANPPYIVSKKIVNPAEKVSLQFKGEENAGAVIFCEGALSNKWIIEALQQVPAGRTAMFYEQGAASIIGSPTKDKTGLVITTN